MLKTCPECIDVWLNGSLRYRYLHSIGGWVSFVSSASYGSYIQNTPEDLHLVELLYARD